MKETTSVPRNGKLAAMCLTAMMAAVICVLAPLSIPIGPVPITLGTLAVYLTVYVLGWRLGTLSVFLYLCLGTLGIPVFSGFSGGLGKLAGPTGGYLLGYLLIALAGGIAVEASSHRPLHALGLVLGTALCYVCGTAWLCVSAHMELGAALGVAVYPFIPFDLGKILLAVGIGPVLRGRLAQAGLLPVKA